MQTQNMELGTWTVVQFVEDGAIEAVPTTWLERDVCYWPRLPELQLMNAIKELEPLNKSWQMHKVKVFRNTTFEDYIEARSKVEAIEESNGLQSVVEPCSNKRKRKQTVATNDDSYEDEQTVWFPPPEIKEEMNMETTNTELLQQEREEDDKEHSSIENQAASCTVCLQNEKALRMIIEQNHVISRLLTDVLIELKDLKDSNRKPGGQTKNFLKKFPHLQFPLTKVEDIVIFDEILSRDKDFEEGVQELSNFGGSNSYQFVKRVLSALITNDLALEYSWLGRKAKKAFATLNIAKLVIYAAERAKIGNNRRQTEQSIQQWLKRASDRKSGKSKTF